MTSNHSVLVLGATSAVGLRIIGQLHERGTTVTAVSRKGQVPTSSFGVTWVEADLMDPASFLDYRQYSIIISTVPIPTFEASLSNFAYSPQSRIIAVSSTSVLTKTHATHAADRDLVSRLLDGESAILRNFEDATILRPTMIHHGPGDRNIEQIVNQLRRMHFFPLIAGGKGKRQPIHADDVARSVMQVLDSNDLRQRIYEIAGAEEISVKDMVQRIADANRLHALFLPVPLPLAQMTLKALSPLPRFRNIPRGSMERMALDMVFDNSPACRDFGFEPAPFIPERY